MIDTVELEETELNYWILLRKVNFAFMIPNPSDLDCSYVVLWGKFEPRCSYKIVLIKIKCMLNIKFSS